VSRFRLDTQKKGHSRKDELGGGEMSGCALCMAHDPSADKKRRGGEKKENKRGKSVSGKLK